MKRTVAAVRRIAKKQILREMRRGRNPFFGAQGPRGPKHPKDLRGCKGLLLKDAEERARAQETDSVRPDTGRS